MNNLYCEEGNKPKVEYSFKDKKGIFISKHSPIEVITLIGLKNSNGDKYNAEGFTINFVGGEKRSVINYRTQKGEKEIQYWSCGGSDWDNRQPDGTYPVWYNSPGILSLDYSKKCPPPYPNQDCILTVKYNEIILFSIRGECPLNFNVICGNCPQGTQECKHNAYPGYCCIPCESTVQKIKALALKVGKYNGRM